VMIGLLLSRRDGQTWADGTSGGDNQVPQFVLAPVFVQNNNIDIVSQVTHILWFCFVNFRV
jgi:hypothetical protein